MSEDAPVAPEPAPAPAPPSPAPTVAAPTRGWALFVGGAATLPVAFGVALGYWVADREVRWLPDVVGGLALLVAVGLLLMVAGGNLLGPARGGRGRKRLLTLGALVVLAAGVKLGAHLLARPNPLTARPPAEVALTFAQDADHYTALEHGLKGLVDVIEAQPGLFVEGATRVPTADEEAVLVEAWTGFVHAAGELDALRQFYEGYYGFDLSRRERPLHVRSFLLTFAAELALYEQAARLSELLSKNVNVTKLLAVPRPERGLAKDSVAALRESLTGLSDLGRVVAGKQYLAWLQAAHGVEDELRGQGLHWLWEEVQRLLAVVGERRKSELATVAVTADFAPLRQKLRGWVFPVQKEVAEWMGDTRVKRRPGTYLITAEQTAKLRETLQPGDVLLARKNWYLSNVGLPGYWPHAILYTGDAAALSRAFDQDPDVLAWVAREAGEPLSYTAWLARRFPREWALRLAAEGSHEPLTVIEAISEGVVQNSLEHAAGDGLAAMRPKLPAWVKAQAIARAFGYLGRPYDFDFDFATDHELVCTELVWRSYRPLGDAPGLRMDPIKVAGRYALPANEIARLFQREHARPGAQLEFVVFLDASEKLLRAVPSDEAAFLATPDRPQWDVLQD